MKNKSIDINRASLLKKKKKKKITFLVSGHEELILQFREERFPTQDQTLSGLFCKKKKERLKYR